VKVRLHVPVCMGVGMPVCVCVYICVCTFVRGMYACMHEYGQVLIRRLCATPCVLVSKNMYS